jgi:mRNA interferase MazF
MEINQYEIVLVNLDPTIGSEMKKTRPCTVISPNEMNKYLQTIVVAPLTTSSKPYPTRVEIKHSKTKGWVVLDQIRTVDRKRIVRKLGQLTSAETESVKAVIMEAYVE